MRGVRKLFFAGQTHNLTDFGNSIMRSQALGTVLFSLILAVSFTNANAASLKVCLVSGSAEYESDKSLPVLQKYLEANYDVRCTLIKAIGFEELPGTEALDDCDVALFFTRRLKIDGEPLARVKKYVEAGRPIVALRTASHGFQNFLEMDKLVFGGNYQGHFPNGPVTTARAVAGAEKHPVLNGVATPFTSKYSLYKNTPLVSDTTLLMTGETPDSGGTQPITWTREYKGARVFYTSLGGLDDFENENFLRMIANSLFWTAKRDVAKK